MKRRRHVRENPLSTTELAVGAVAGLAALGGIVYYFATKSTAATTAAQNNPNTSD
jgi:hypothetical protein